ncbi:MAG TPA: hypothetical protein VFC63_09260 [Blastocatellia bacterium]|nr:hypothetical protein [Blastocatellia bacterium]
MKRVIPAIIAAASFFAGICVENLWISHRMLLLVAILPQCAGVLGWLIANRFHKGLGRALGIILPSVFYLSFGAQLMQANSSREGCGLMGLFSIMFVLMGTLYHAFMGAMIQIGLYLGRRQ